jgi:DNA polymerase type B, organellar and viral
MELYQFTIEVSPDIEEAPDIANVVIDVLDAEHFINEPVRVLIKLRTPSGGWFVIPELTVDVRVNEGEDALVAKIMESLERWGSRDHHGDSGELEPFDQIQLMISRFTAGGCGKYQKRVLVNGIAVHSLKSSHNGCFVQVIANCLGKENRSYCLQRSFNEWCKEAHAMIFPIGDQISYVHAGKFAEFFECRIIVYNKEMKVLIDSNEDSETTLSEGEDDEEERSKCVEMMFMDGHYFKVVNKRAEATQCGRCKHWFKKPHRVCTYKYCELCGTWYARKHTKCDTSKKAFLMNSDRRKARNTLVLPVDIFIQQVPSRNNVVFFDYECLSDAEHHTQFCYAAGWKSLSTGAYSSSWGRGAIAEFVDAMETLFNAGGGKRKLVLVGYNNSGYDNHFLISELLSRGIEPKFVIHNNCIIQMSCKWFKCFDVYRFLPGSSLAAACKDFGAPPELTKTHFPHKFIDSYDKLDYVGPAPSKEFYYRPDELPSDWEFPEVWNLREVCLDYLNKDVVATEFVATKLWDLFFETFKVDMLKFATLSQFGYEFWANLVTTSKRGRSFSPSEFPLAEEHTFIEIPDTEKHEFIKRATFGGRVYPTRKYYECPQYNEVKEGKVKPDDLEEFLYVGDVVSLYPTAMHDFAYPVGRSRWVDDTRVYQDRLDTGFYGDIPLGFWLARYRPNKKLIIPALPTKSFTESTVIDGDFRSTGISWNLNDGEGVYTNVDLMSAHRLGYEIQLIRGLIYEDTSRIFKDYIEVCFEIKSRGEREQNESLRNIGKLVMNALYGKMLQMPIVADHKFLRDRKSLEDFRTDHHIIDLIFVPNDERTVIVKGLVKELTEAITKPAQLGAYVLSYSRLVMDKYIAIFDPDRTKNWAASMDNSFVYTDTDSLHLIINKQYQRDAIAKYGTANVLGNFTNDLKGKNCKVIKAIYVAPKTYYLEYIDSDGVVRIKKKCKGVPGRLFDEKDYMELLETGDSRQVHIETIKKVGLSHAVVLKRERQPFEVVNAPFPRKLGNQIWDGRYFFTNDMTSFPYGFEFEEGMAKGLESTILGESMEVSQSDEK